MTQIMANERRQGINTREMVLRDSIILFVGGGKRKGEWGSVD